MVDPMDDWASVLAYRTSDDIVSTVVTLERHGITSAQLRWHLADGGDALWTATTIAAGANWADQFGGAAAAAVLAREVQEYSAHLAARAATVRSRAVNTLLARFSVAAIAESFGISRQAVDKVARGRGGPAEFITKIWRMS